MPIKYKPIKVAQERLHELFDYDELSGELSRRNDNMNISNKAWSGNNKPSPSGYTKIMVDGIEYRKHRLIWVYVYGREPHGEIDHINGNRSDNRLCNLREVDRRTNCTNRDVHRKGKLAGTYFSHGAWFARIRIDGITKHIGKFESEMEAHDAYVKAREELNG